MMIKTQITPTVNVAPPTTPLVTDFHATTACQFCTCGAVGFNVCTASNEAPSPVLTIIERETPTATHYAIIIADPRDGSTIDALRGHHKYTTPCAALAGAAKLSHSLAMPVRFTAIDGVDWNAINVEVSGRLYSRGLAAYEQSGGDEKYGFCETTQRIYAGPIMATRTINIHPARILDNEVTRQGWDAAAALDEADAVLGAEGFAYDTDIDGVPIAEETPIRIAQVEGCVITLIAVDGGYQVERFLITPERTDMMVSLDSALLVFDVMVEEEQEVLLDMVAEAEAHLPNVIIADTISLDKIPF